MSTETNSTKGLLPGDDRIKDHILYSRGNCWTPKRFYDYILIDTRKPYNHDGIIKMGFILDDINNVINQFGGISFEFIGN